MSIFAPFKKKEQFKVPYSAYIKTEDKPAEDDTKPHEQPENPAQPEAK